MTDQDLRVPPSNHFEKLRGKPMRPKRRLLFFGLICTATGFALGGVTLPKPRGVYVRRRR